MSGHFVTPVYGHETVWLRFDCSHRGSDSDCRRPCGCVGAGHAPECQCIPLPRRGEICNWLEWHYLSECGPDAEIDLSVGTPIQFRWDPSCDSVRWSVIGV